MSEPAPEKKILAAGNSDVQGMSRNPNGTWTAKSYEKSFTGTHQECQEWLRGNGRVRV